MTIKGNIEDKTYCSKSKQKTNHGYIEKYEINSSQFPDLEFGFSDCYYIIKCLGCDTIAFYSEYGDEEKIEGDRYGRPVGYTNKFVYPEEPVTATYEREPSHVAKKNRKCTRTNRGVIYIGRICFQCKASFIMRNRFKNDC